jgi:anti-anti-sigma regulatory factor
LTLIDRRARTGTSADRPVVTVPLTGDFDVAREGELLHLIRVLDLPAASVVRLEMSRVRSVDDAGLRGILAARAYLEGSGCELQLLRPGSQLLQLLDVAGLTLVLTVTAEPH